MLVAGLSARHQRAFPRLSQWVDAQIPTDKLRIYAILDNLDMHYCRDLLLFQIHHPRWEFVYQPEYAAYLNLIEPWWKVLRSFYPFRGGVLAYVGSH